MQSSLLYISVFYMPFPLIRIFLNIISPKILFIKSFYKPINAIKHNTAVITENTATTLVSGHPHNSK